jgi:hypothetical protein
MAYAIDGVQARTMAASHAPPDTAGVAGISDPNAAAPAETSITPIAHTRSARMTAVEASYGTAWRRRRITARSTSPVLAGVRLLIVFAKDTSGTSVTRAIGLPTAAIRLRDRSAQRRTTATLRASAASRSDGSKREDSAAASHGRVRHTTNTRSAAETTPQSNARRT